MKKVVLCVVALGVISIANASCVCKCVNGEVEPICSSSTELPPICSPRVCPITPPSVVPINPPTIPPIGTSNCGMEQVYNDSSYRYEWKQICR